MSGKHENASRALLGVLAITVFAALGPVGPAAAAVAPAEQPAAGDQDVDQALLELRVRTALLEKVGLPVADVSVKATLGEIWLLGTVKNDSASETAQDVAELVEGVKTVHNQIKVVDPHQVGESSATRAAQKVEHNVDDGLLELKLKSKLISELGKSAFHLEVESHGGVVNLSGTVDQTRRDLAIKVAERYPGVKKVIDLMKIAG